MEYFRELNRKISSIEVTESGQGLISFDRAISKVTGLIKQLDKNKNKIIFIGNGGSASIANHIATDFLKNAGIPSIAFSDSSLITCLSNDLGYDYVFQKPIEILAKKGDILFSISSSGMSKNIINAAKAAKARGCFLITLSGFKKQNSLRKSGRINFFVPSDSYGIVEITHLAICHCIVDEFTVKKTGHGQI